MSGVRAIDMLILPSSASGIFAELYRRNKMRRMKIFCEKTMDELQEKVNQFFDNNPNISLESASATDVMVDGECLTSLYLFYLES